jgi:tripartite-type tricarboxylate transporter receptor subunit TctC
MVSDLLGGQVQVGIDVVAGSLPHIRSGALRALTVTTDARLEALPDVPTVAETIPGFEAVAWTGVGVPRSTPEAVVNLLNREINAGLMDPAIRARLTELTVTPLLLTAAEFGAYTTAETNKWTKVVPAKLPPSGLTRARAPGVCRTQSLPQPCPRGSRESGCGGRP